jgi:hypothetical protein
LFFYDRGKPNFLLVVDLEFWVPLLPAPKVKKQTNVFQKKIGNTKGQDTNKLLTCWVGSAKIAC